jgi:hypothetical protein
MTIIRNRNLLNQDAPKTYLASAAEVGTNILTWQNPNGLSTSWAVQIGETGGEQTEVVLLGTQTSFGTTGSIAGTTLYSHPADTPVYGIKYNQVVFLRSDTGTAGTATALTNGTVTYQPDNEFTIFDDTTSDSAHAYRTRFRNSVLDVTTTDSDWITFAGFSFYSLAKLRERARNKLWNASWITDEILDEWINEWKDEMTNEVVQTNEDYALGTTEVAFGTSGLGTISDEDFTSPIRVWVTYNGTDKFKSTKMKVNSFIPDQIFHATSPAHYFQGNDVMGFKPEGPGTAEIVFNRLGTTLVNDTDELPRPMRPYTKSFTDYVTAQALYKDEKHEAGDRRMAQAARDKQNFLLNLSPRDKSGITMIEMVEAISSDLDLF